FRPTTGTRHLHRDYNFTGSLEETAPKSLRHSCRSELTRQGISLIVLFGHVHTGQPNGNGTSFDAAPLHVAMQMGLSHDPLSRVSGVQSLRILISSCLGFLRFIVCMISTMSARPA